MDICFIGDILKSSWLKCLCTISGIRGSQRNLFTELGCWLQGMVVWMMSGVLPDNVWGRVLGYRVCATQDEGNAWSFELSCTFALLSSACGSELHLLLYTLPPPSPFFGGRGGGALLRCFSFIHVCSVQTSMCRFQSHFSKEWLVCVCAVNFLCCLNAVVSK